MNASRILYSVTKLLSLLLPLPGRYYTPAEPAVPYHHSTSTSTRQILRNLDHHHHHKQGRTLAGWPVCSRVCLGGSRRQKEGTIDGWTMETMFRWELEFCFPFCCFIVTNHPPARYSQIVCSLAALRFCCPTTIPISLFHYFL